MYCPTTVALTLPEVSVKTIPRLSWDVEDGGSHLWRPHCHLLPGNRCAAGKADGTIVTTARKPPFKIERGRFDCFYSASLDLRCELAVVKRSGRFGITGTTRLAA